MLHNILYICLIKRIQQIKNAVFTLYNNINNKEEFTAWSYDEKIKNSEKHGVFHDKTIAMDNNAIYYFYRLHYY